jgi:hypothetical protein
MDLGEYAEAKGVEPKPKTLAEWFEEHPSIRQQIIEGWTKGYPAPLMAAWLEDEHDWKVSSDYLGRWCKRVLGP